MAADTREYCGGVEPSYMRIKNCSRSAARGKLNVATGDRSTNPCGAGFGATPLPKFAFCLRTSNPPPVGGVAFIASVSVVLVIAVTSTAGRSALTAFTPGAGCNGSAASSAGAFPSVIDRQSAHSFANPSLYSSNSGAPAWLAIFTRRTTRLAASAASLPEVNGAARLTRSPGHTSPPAC